MGKGKNTAGRRMAVKAAAAALLFLALQGTVTGCNGRAEESEVMDKESTMCRGMLQEIAGTAEKNLYAMFMPCILFETSGSHETFWLLQEQIDSLFPLYGYVAGNLGEDEMTGRTLPEDGNLREILLEEAKERFPEDESDEQLSEQNLPEETERSLAELLKAENEAAVQARENIQFTPHTQQVQIDLESLQDYDTLLKQFYIVDSTTNTNSRLLNVESFQAKDMTVPKDDGSPQILIFHTHSREAFADSVQGDASTTIVGVGERLARILTDTYGYNVIHHTAEYDADRNQAYSKALPEIEQILKANPSIQVVIDLHRDEMPEETRLVMDMDGRPTARFMFFNGLSRTKKTGDITYLYNENLDGNLAFSFQMQKKAMEYYPGLTRKIYLKGYRYNMHLKDKYLLVELGAQNNTLEEALNACDPLAHILYLVLSGE